MAAAINNLADFPNFAGVEINHDRLGFAFCLALAIHAAFILGVSFTREKPALASPKLDITLAPHRSKTAPEETDYLAQSHQQGSGTLKEKAILTTPELAGFQVATIPKVSQKKQQSQSERQLTANTKITTSAFSLSKTNRQQQQEPTEQVDQRQADKMTMLQRSQEIASLEAKRHIQRQAYAKRPRVRRLTSVATTQSDDARYLHNWRTKVEAMGNQHYPEQAKQQQLFGKLRMMVSILPNGDVYQVKILQSSGHKILDQAALKIVHLAAPYAPFPQAMQRKVDVLEIIRTWHFHKDKLYYST